MTWHVTLWFDAIYSLFYSTLMLGFHFYKGFGGLAYPPAVWGLEFSGLIMLTIVTLIRVFYGFRANRSESRPSAVFFFVLTVLSMLVVIHFSFLTTYVLQVEIILSLILLILCVLELTLAIAGIIRFKV